MSDKKNKVQTPRKRPMTRAEEDSFLDEFPYLPNNKLTPDEKRLVSQYGQEFGQYININLKGAKTA